MINEPVCMVEARAMTELNILLVGSLYKTIFIVAF